MREGMHEKKKNQLSPRSFCVTGRDEFPLETKDTLWEKVQENLGKP